MYNTLAVGLGEIKISRDPGDLLVAYGLGSCLGIGVYDPVIRLAGMLHAILPVNPNGSTENAGKYVDSGVAMLLEQLIRLGGDRKRFILRMAGGANMLVAPGMTSVLNVGSRNVESAFATFSAMNLKLASHEVGGNTGRTVRFYVADGRMTIRTMGNQEREI
jgi:chemotaxis protein CheD